mmetsp:Transcript_112575/g.317975  ORF Transcript_112575/g.317975 Transcript_112575/m.317975 type:complete len:232 (+) Transcript_112575:1588-2283(+)
MELAELSTLASRGTAGTTAAGPSCERGGDASASGVVTRTSGGSLGDLPATEPESLDAPGDSPRRVLLLLVARPASASDSTSAAPSKPKSCSACTASSRSGETKSDATSIWDARSGEPLSSRSRFGVGDADSEIRPSLGAELDRLISCLTSGVRILREKLASGAEAGVATVNRDKLASGAEAGVPTANNPTGTPATPALDPPALPQRLLAVPVPAVRSEIRVKPFPGCGTLT